MNRPEILKGDSLKRLLQGTAFGAVATLIVGFIMYYIIPKFKKIFEDFNTELPEITVVLIGLLLAALIIASFSCKSAKDG